MKVDDFEIILLVIFISKLLWNVIFPAIKEWQWHFGNSDKEPRSFNMLIGLETLVLMIFSVWSSYRAGSYIHGIVIVFFGVVFIIISYVLSIAITRFIRNLPVHPWEK